jgi:hypothetical protein
VLGRTFAHLLPHRENGASSSYCRLMAVQLAYASFSWTGTVRGAWQNAASTLYGGKMHVTSPSCRSETFLSLKASYTE